MREVTIINDIYDTWSVEHGYSRRPPGDTPDDGPIVCSCGNNTFTVFYPRDYQTDVRCTACGLADTVHTG